MALAGLSSPRPRAPGRARASAGRAGRGGARRLGLQAGRLERRRALGADQRRVHEQENPPGAGARGAGDDAVEHDAAVAPGVPRALGAARRRLVVLAGTYGGLETMQSKRSPATGSNRSPRSARTRTPLRRALSRAVSDRAPRDVDGGGVARPRRAAVTASDAAAGAQVEHARARAAASRAAARRRASSESRDRAEDAGQRHDPHGRAYPLPRRRKPMSLDADDLRAPFDAPAPLTVGLEEELMLLDPDDARPRAASRREVLARPRRRPALQARAARRAARARRCRPPRRSAEALAELAGARARRSLAAADGPRAARGARACTRSRAGEGELNAGERYDRDRRASTASIARRQLVVRAPGPRRGRRRRPRARRLQRAARATCPSSRRSPPTRRSTTGRDTGPGLDAAA